MSGTPNLVADRPRYYSVYRVIADEIAEGTLKPGDRLPVERALCDRFGVSRATIRRAVAALASEGLIESQMRRGSFVSSGPLSEPPNVLISFSEMAAARGFTATSQVRLHQVRGAVIDESERLRIAPGAGLFELERVRLLDGQPVLFERSRLPLVRTAGVEAADYSTESLYATLERLGARPARADYTIEAIAADQGLAELLDAEAGTPLLSVEDLTFDANGDPILWSRQIYRGDRYRFRTTLHRPSSGGVPLFGDGHRP